MSTPFSQILSATRRALDRAQTFLTQFSSDSNRNHFVSRIWDILVPKKQHQKNIC